MSSKKKDPPEPMEEKELPAQESEKAPEAPQPEPEKAPEKEPEKPAEPPAEALLKAEKDKYLRLLAEYDNYRKRSQKEKESLYTDIRSETVEKFLPVDDNLERALAQETQDAAFKKGVEMTMNQLVSVMEKLGVVSFGAAGEAFDPQLHNAVMHVEDEALGENVIAEVFQKGFKVGDKVVRFAMVKVAN